MIAKPDYKKAYVTLRNLLSVSPDLYPIRIFQEDKIQMNTQPTCNVVEEGEAKRHWLHGKEAKEVASTQKGVRRGLADRTDEFPWSSMRLSGSR